MSNGYRRRMEPGAYDALTHALREHIEKARRSIDTAARTGTLDQIRYHAGQRDGLEKTLLILEGRNE